MSLPNEAIAVRADASGAKASTAEKPVYRAGFENQFHAARCDIWRSATGWRIAIMLAWNDIAMRYRRSLIGPFWITIQTAVWALAIGIVYGGLFGQDMKAFLPFVAIGIILWSMIGGLIQDGIVAFSHSAPYLLQAQMPKTIFIARVVIRQGFIFLHNCVVILGISLWAGTPLSLGMLLALAGLAIIVVAGAGIGMALAVIGARFRDLVQGVQSFLQVMFFMTPIMWKPEMLGGRVRFVLVDWNPFAAMIEVVRAPLLSEPVSLRSWIFATAIAGIALLAGFFVFARYRARINYWL